MRKTRTEVTAAAHAANDAKRAAADQERATQDRIAVAAWFGFLDARVPELRGEVFRQIERLGGYRKAREAFAAG